MKKYALILAMFFSVHGGFAQKYDAPCVIINPSMQPSRTMSTRIGIACVNYNTGVAFDVTQDHVDQYVACETAIANNTNGALINVFLARDDDLLNYRETLHAIPFAASTENPSFPSWARSCPRLTRRQTRELEAAAAPCRHIQARQSGQPALRSPSR